MKQPCGMYVETQESVCFSSALFSCILCMYSRQRVYIFAINVVFLCMLIRAVDMKSACMSITTLPCVHQETVLKEQTVKAG